MTKPIFYLGLTLKFSLCLTYDPSFMGQAGHYSQGTDVLMNGRSGLLFSPCGIRDFGLDSSELALE